MKTHIISALVENNFGVLSRVSGLFSSRGFNIQSLTVGPTEEADVSLMTLTVAADEATLEQVKKQLNKLVEVIKVKDLTETEHLERGMVLAKVNVDAGRRAEIIAVAAIFRANIIDVSDKSLILEVTGNNKKIRALLDTLKPFGIQEVVRTGIVGIARS